MHNAALERLRFPRQQISSGAAEIKPTKQPQQKEEWRPIEEEWRLIAHGDVRGFIDEGDTIKIANDSAYDGVYTFHSSRYEHDLKLMLGDRGWYTIDEEAEIYLKWRNKND